MSAEEPLFVDNEELKLVIFAESAGILLHPHTKHNLAEVGRMMWKWKENFNVMQKADRDKLKGLKCMQDVFESRDFRRLEWERMLQQAETYERVFLCGRPFIPLHETFRNDPVGRWVFDEFVAAGPWTANKYSRLPDSQAFRRLVSVRYFESRQAKSAYELHSALTTSGPRKIPARRSPYMQSSITALYPARPRDSTISHPRRGPWGPDLTHCADSRSKSASACCVCTENAAGCVVFVPCGHVCTCFSCTRLICYENGVVLKPQAEPRCPLCNSHFQMYVRLFQ
jgi:hypothetical protein